MVERAPTVDKNYLLADRSCKLAVVGLVDRSAAQGEVTVSMEDVLLVVSKDYRKA